jgi:poly-gamma-glutamate capsule biosynthesis protein CapA/YwtB (metallophosphatase superfamily)
VPTPWNQAPQRFVLALIGDVMLAGLPAAEMSQTAPRVWEPIDGADAILLNLEVPVTDASAPYLDKRYCFRCDPEALRLFDQRFIIGLANNHIFDFGERGLLDTLEALRARNLRCVGAGRNLQEAGPAVVEVNGMRLGVVCAADPRYHPATQRSAGTFPAIPELLRDGLRDLRSRADVLVASIHCGQEFLPVPSSRQRQLADLCLEEGARVVCFHHAHCVSGIQNEDRGAVFYGLGNYIFPPGDTPAAYTAFQESAAWRVALDRSSLAVQEIHVQPVILSKEGRPATAPAGASDRIRRRIQRYSRRIASGHIRGWRLCAMASPVYLWMNAVNYLDIARRQGVRAALRMLVEGIKTQLTRERQGQ